ncbi:DMT family transporter [Halospeciosus flavus]|uniref:DMT family transporter n=1 Tax=Halospeciosus flavus TaxID=3032283 RepID=A0ABD5Z1N9_9EURY|nr:DMT family transporter [Halospeciosus flavus]
MPETLRCSAHTRAVAVALFVTVLWSSSYVLVEVGLRSIPALTFAGLRYGLAAVVLVAAMGYRGDHRALREASGRDWDVLVVLGVLLYALTQGAQFVALQHLPPATVSLVLTFTPIVVAVLSFPLLGELPNGRQLGGIALLFVGVAAYFHPFTVPASEVFGLAVMGVGLLGNALAAVFGREANRDAHLPSLAVTAVSTSVGAALLLGTGLLTQGLPTLGVDEWAIVGWLAVVNTAFAFTLWNRSLQHLSAVESSVVNNTMLVQVGAFGWVFLGVSLTPLDVAGMVLVTVGVVGVQVAGRR